MKTINTAKKVLIIIGIGSLIGFFFMHKYTTEFIETTILTKGTVVELLEEYSSKTSSSYDRTVTYRPIVEFFDEAGNQIIYTSSTSCNPPEYNVGEEIEILYNKESPIDAKINSFFSIWGGTTILGIFGGVSFALGGAIFVHQKKKNDLRKHLKQYGTIIESDFQRVKSIKSSNSEGLNFYQIVSQLHNSSTSTPQIFKSEYIGFDPTDFVKDQKIKVLIDKREPKKYLVDLSFLPEVE